MAPEVVDAVLAWVGRDAVRVHPLGRSEPHWLVSRRLFDGQGLRRPKTGMLVHVWLDGGMVQRLQRYVATEDEETRRRALLAALRGLGRSMEGEVAKAAREGWTVPPVYVEVVAALRDAGELQPGRPHGRGRSPVQRHARAG